MTRRNGGRCPRPPCPIFPHDPAHRIAAGLYLPAVRTALLSALETPMTPFWVWLAFAETPSPATLTGGTVVFAAVVWYVVHDARRTG